MFRLLTIRIVFAALVVGILGGYSSSISVASGCPQYIGGWSYGPVIAADAVGDLAVAGSGSVLQVIDVSDPTNPIVVGETDLPDIPFRVILAGDYAYVATGRAGLKIVDVSTPSNPVVVGTIDTPDFARDLALSGHIVFIADLWGGLRVVDVSSPSAPVEIAADETLRAAYCIAYSDGYVYVEDLIGLYVYDVSDPTAPDLKGSTTVSDPTIYAVKIDVVDGYAYVARYDSNPYPTDDGGLQVVDVHDPTSPTVVTTASTTGHAYGVAVSGPNAFVADGMGGLVIFDVGTPTFPVEVTTLQTGRGASAVAVDGGFAFVSCGGEGLRIVDVTAPGSPLEVGALDAPYGADHIAVSNGIAYIENSWDGMRVIDVTSPSEPREIAAHSSSGWVRDLAVAGSHTYLVTTDGLRIVDVSDPSTPFEVGALDTPGISYDVAVSNGYAYLVEYDGTLRIIDVSTPTTPIEVGTFISDTWYGLAVAVSGDFAYVAASSYGLRVIDVSDPTSPTLAAMLNTPGFVNDVAVFGNHAFLADNRKDYYDSHLRVVDISTPSSPVDMGAARVLYKTLGLAASHGFVYVASQGALRVFDVGDPRAPRSRSLPLKRRDGPQESLSRRVSRTWRTALSCCPLSRRASCSAMILNRVRSLLGRHRSTDCGDSALNFPAVQGNRYG